MNDAILTRAQIREKLWSLPVWNHHEVWRTAIRQQIATQIQPWKQEIANGLSDMLVDNMSNIVLAFVPTMVGFGNEVFGKKEGVFYTFLPRIEFFGIELYQRDKVHGIAMAAFMYSDDFFQESHVTFATYIEGVKTSATSWYMNGQLKITCPFVNGKRHGNERHWHANGTIAYLKPFVNGNAHGVGEERDWNGFLIRRTEWDDGHLVNPVTRRIEFAAAD